MSTALLCGQHEHAMPAARKFQPGKIDFRVQRLNVHLAIADFNNQLQRFLQSPLLRDKGIPPVSNLKFLEDFSELEVQTKADEKIIEFIVDLPINKQ